MTWSEEFTAAAVGRDERIARDVAQARGVVHTPPELALWMVRRVDRLLRRELCLAEGLADRRVRVVDPAVGPGVFLRALLEVAPRPGVPSVGGGSVGVDLDADAVREAERLLRGPYRAAGTELLLREADALTLGPADLMPSPDDVLVLLGNPPWRAARDASAGGPKTRRASPEAYLLGEDGRPLEERKTGVLADAYVQFFAWAQGLVEAAPQGGVLAFVTNASFLDGPVHRGMRASLARTFDGLEVLDLGGSALVGRGAGAQDGNVFGVRPGAAITVAWRVAGGPRRGADRSALRYRRLRGSPAEKLRALAGDQVGEAVLLEGGARPWAARRAAPPDYGRWVSLAEVMPFHAEGVQTNRDEACTAPDPETLTARLWAFVRGEPFEGFGPALRPLPHYNPELARARVAAWLRSAEGHPREAPAVPLAYRPFEVRWFAPVAPFCHRPRPALLRAFAHGGAALLTVRKDRGALPWAHVAASAHVPDNCFFSSRSSCRARAFPARRPDGALNFDPLALAPWPKAIRTEAGAAEVRHYSLAVLSAPTFRAALSDALKDDYPRLPTPPSLDAFRALVALGMRLETAWLAPHRPGDGGAAAAVGHRVVRDAALASLAAEADTILLRR